MSRALGQLPGAPLAYVLAEVRFAAVFDVGKRASALHEIIRETFPRAEQLQAVPISLAGQGGGAISIFVFTNLNRTAAVAVAQNSLSLSVTDYSTFKAFSEQLRSLWKAAETLFSNDLVERFGLRYVDVIVPRENESPFKYLASHFTNVVDQSWNTVPKIQLVLEYPRESGGLTVRVLALGGPLYSSPDLPPLPMMQPQWVSEAQAAQRQACILDTDRWSVEEQLFKSDWLTDRCAILKKDISATFKRTVTEYALDVWSRPRGQ